VVELIEQAKARGAAIVGIFHDETVRARGGQTAPDGDQRMIINNVKLVLENEVVDGSIEIQDGVIRAFAETQSRSPEAMDGEGGWLLPGLIELHTDNLDKFFTPRPKVDWPAHSAMSSHDALMVASGITTVLDAVAIGDVRDGGDRLENLEKMINAVEETQKRGLNRAEHRLHLRCELPHHTTLPLFEKLVGREPVSLVSLMDHSPGQRQFANIEKYREYYQGKYSSAMTRWRVTKKSSWRWRRSGRSQTASPLPPCAVTAISRWPAMTTPRTIMCSNPTSLAA
jgi:phosphonate metabolism protein PhnM